MGNHGVIHLLQHHCTMPPPTCCTARCLGSRSSQRAPGLKWHCQNPPGSTAVCSHSIPVGKRSILSGHFTPHIGRIRCLFKSRKSCVCLLTHTHTQMGVGRKRENLNVLLTRFPNIIHASPPLAQIPKVQKGQFMHLLKVQPGSSVKCIIIFFLKKKLFFKKK